MHGGAGRELRKGGGWLMGRRGALGGREYGAEALDRATWVGRLSEYLVAHSTLRSCMCYGTYELFQCGNMVCYATLSSTFVFMV